jgi:hypothetical protein
MNKAPSSEPLREKSAEVLVKSGGQVLQDAGIALLPA